MARRRLVWKDPGMDALRIGIVWNPSKTSKEELESGLTDAAASAGAEPRVTWWETTPDDAGQGAAASALADGADVIVAAMGSAGFVTSDKIKDGAVLVDVGVSRVYDEEAGRYRIKGDVDKACYDKASAYTPNPGGVGPMTRAMLLANVVEMAERHA